MSVCLWEGRNEREKRMMGRKIKKTKTQVEKEEIKCIAKFLVLGVNKSSFKSKYIVDSYKLNLVVCAVIISYSSILYRFAAYTHTHMLWINYYDLC